MPTEYKKVTVVVLYKDRTWEERECQFLLPADATDEEIYRHAVHATMSNLAGLGKIEDVYTVSVITGTQDIEIEYKEKKEKNGT